MESGKVPKDSNKRLVAENLIKETDKPPSPPNKRRVKFSIEEIGDSDSDTDMWFTGDIGHTGIDIINSDSDNDYGFEDYDPSECIWETNPEHAIASYLNNLEDDLLRKRSRMARYFKYSGPKITNEEKIMRDELHGNMKKLCKDLMIIEQM